VKLLWVTMNLEDGNRIAYAGPDVRTAMRVAAALVGNNAVADTGEIKLYGPGNGTTSVMVRQLPSHWIDPADSSKLVAAIRAVANGLHYNATNMGWECGPWADPQTPEGEGGVVQLIREAVASLPATPLVNGYESEGVD
jgi:hypothetical protein